MEKEIFFEDQVQGRAVIEKEGGYYRVDACCTYKDGIHRLYITSAHQFTRLGVMMPISGELRLTRRISPHELGIAPEDGKFVLMAGANTPVLVPASDVPVQTGILASTPIITAKPGDMQPDPVQTDDNTQSDTETDAGPPNLIDSFLKESRPENPPDSPAGIIDRWSQCENAGDFTRDEILKPLLCALEGVLYRYRGGGVELAVPAQAAGAISAVLCLTRAEQIRGADYFVVNLDRSGFPAPAIEASRY